MGKGDIKTRKGKISKGTFGVRRLKKHVAAYVAPAKPAAKKVIESEEKPAPKKTKAKKAED